jgi:hypothetical protein
MTTQHLAMMYCFRSIYTKDVQLRPMGKHFGREFGNTERRIHEICPLGYRLPNTIVSERVSHIISRCLGMDVNHELKWNYHVNELIKTFTQKLNVRKLGTNIFSTSLWLKREEDYIENFAFLLVYPWLIRVRRML